MKYIIAAIAALTLLFGCAAIASKTYSDGERTGVITKISHKGFIWKTWEGQMNVGGASASQGGTMMPVVWSFTASDQTKGALEAASRDGRKTTIHYRQVYVQWPWNGDTDYLVISVE